MVTKMKNFLKFKTGETQMDARKFGEEYYLREARIWRPFRWAGMMSTILALVLTVASIFNQYWLHITWKSRDGNQKSIESSLWESACWKLDVDMRSPECKDTRPNWQNAVIGLMIFSAAFGFVAAILAICGVCTSPLPKKIYYFHSAGEIFFVCALTTTVALIIYAVAISMDASIHSHTYGSGYGLGWGGTAFFFAASFCMSLDELVRESAQNKCCRYLFWRSRSNERENSQHV